MNRARSAMKLDPAGTGPQIGRAGGDMVLGANGADSAWAKPSSAHVIVIGNEKGGSGKSTVAIHVAIALLKAGQRVATVDLDSRQCSLTHYVERRRQWSKHAKLHLELPMHYRVARGESIRLDENEATEFSDFAQAVSAVERTHDFVVVDTPGADTYLARLAHSMADTLITPLNDSMLDLDVLAIVDPLTLKFTGAGHYAEIVREARRQRRLVDGKMMDWIVVRNRLTAAATRNRRVVAAALEALSGRIGCRFVDGFAERVIYREFFPRGVTAVDPIDAAILGARPSLSHVAAQEEVRSLLAALKLPVNERGRRRVAERAQWAAASREPLELDDVLDGILAD
jgi:chromosome partitioning protein